MDLQALHANYQPITLGDTGQTRQAPGGLRGFLTSLLPILGGGAGALIGSLAGPGGTIAGGAAGAALGETGKEKISGQKLSAKNIAIQGGLGALPGVFEGIKALRAGAAGAEALAGAGEAGATRIPITDISQEFAGRGVAETAPGRLVNPTVGELQDLTGKGFTGEVGRTRFPVDAVRTGGTQSPMAPVSEVPVVNTAGARTTVPLSPTGPPQTSFLNRMVEQPAEAPVAPTVAPKPGLIQRGLNDAAFTGQQLEARAGGMGVGAKVPGAEPLLPSESAKLTEFLDSKGIPRLEPAKRLVPIEQNMTNIGSQIGQHIENNNIPLTAGDRQAIADRYLAEFSKGPRSPQAQAAAEHLANDLVNQPNVNSLQDLFDYKRGADTNFINYSANPSAVQSGQAQAASVLRNVLKEEINSHVPDLASLNNEYHQYGDAASYLVREAGRKANLSLSHPVASLMNSGPVAAGKALVGNAISRGAQALGGELPGAAGAAAPEATGALSQLTGRNLLRQTVRQGVAQGLGGALVGPTQPQDQNAPTDISQVPGATDTTTPTSTPSPYGIDQLMHDINANPKEASSAIALYKALNPTNAAANKASQDKADALNMASASLDAAEQNLLAAGGAKGVGGEAATIPFLGKFINPQGAAYHATKIELATQMAKAITGGSRPGQQVVQYYLHSLPDVNDTPEFAAAKIEKLRSELAAQAQRFGINIGGPTQTSQPDLTSLLQGAQ